MECYSRWWSETATTQKVSKFIIGHLSFVEILFFSFFVSILDNTNNHFWSHNTFYKYKSFILGCIRLWLFWLWLPFLVSLTLECKIVLPLLFAFKLFSCRQGLHNFGFKYREHQLRVAVKHKKNRTISLGHPKNKHSSWILRE